MDFVSNIWSKTGLKKEEGEAAATDPSTDTTTTTTESSATETKDASSSSAAGKGVGFVSNLIKSTFKKDANHTEATAEGDADGAERKTSVTSGGDQEGGSSSLSPKGFVSNIFKNPFKSSSDSRKGSTSSTGGGAGEDRGNEEGGEGSGGEAVTQKAVDSAKHFGSFLSSTLNKAGQAVTATAKHIKHTVVDNSLLADFTKEQAEFVKEHGGHIDAADPPWVGCEAEEEVKKEIISLSQDKRNFVRNPPAGVEFDFNLQSALPIALAILKEDPNLAKMRYEIVPKLVNEETFWRNYFYRVSLLKQSTAANSLGKGGRTRGSTSSSEAEGPDEISPTSEMQPEFITHQDSLQRQDTTASQSNNPFKQSSLSRYDSKTADEKRWEDEITKDLQEFEVVGGDGSGGEGIEPVNEEELEKDLAALDAK